MSTFASANWLDYCSSRSDSSNSGRRSKANSPTTTSGKIDVAAPPPILTADTRPATMADETGLLDRLAGDDLARLTLGFHCVFWGALVMLAALCETLTSMSVQLLPAVVLGAGS